MARHRRAAARDRVGRSRSGRFARRARSVAPMEHARAERAASGSPGRRPDGRRRHGRQSADAEQERWISLERGTMLPAFMRVAAPAVHRGAGRRPCGSSPSAISATDRPRRTALGETIAAYHKDRPFDWRITLGDNFYSVGMESQPIRAGRRSRSRCTAGSASPSTQLSATTTGDIRIVPPPKSCTPPRRRLADAGSYYTYTAGPVQFFALDTQSIARLEKQLRWLDAELARSQSRWKVVYGHHPIYSGGNYEDRPDLIARLLPILKDRADVYTGRPRSQPPGAPAGREPPLLHRRRRRGRALRLAPLRTIDLRQPRQRVCGD